MPKSRAFLFFSFLLASFNSFASSNVDRTAAVNAEFRTVDRSEGVNFEVVEDIGGNARSVIGKFDVGLDATTSFRPDAVANAVADFISAHAAAWGHPEGFRPTLVPGDVLAIDAYFHVAAFDQYVGDHKVLDGQLTATFWRDGLLNSVNGRVASWGDVATEPVLGDVITSFADAGVVIDDAGTLERGLSLNFGAVVWRYRSGGRTVVLDEDTLIVLHADDGSEAVTGPCLVNRRDWTRTGGWTTTLNESGNQLSEQITCEASDFLGTCTWQLRREPFGFEHGIARVLDADGSEQEDVQSCASGDVPEFVGTGGDWLREQGAFYVENQMRFYIDQNVWSQVTGESSDNVRITVDDSGVATAAFNEFWTDIRCNQNGNCPGFGCCDQDNLSHEYGHYVVHSYGGNYDDQCNPGTEEGNALDETMATTLAELFWMDDPETYAQYGAIGGFASGNGPSAHFSAVTPLAAAPSCPNGQAPNGTDGQPFQQAVWELMFNRDCTVDNCVATTGDGDRIWVGLSQETVLTRVGAALGFALSVLGTNNITHDMVRAQMRNKIIADADGPTGMRAQRVFSHHGLNCPTCCTGC